SRKRDLLGACLARRAAKPPAQDGECLMDTNRIPANQPLVERLPEVRGSYRPQADLSKINWFNVGGPAEVMFRPADVQDLAHFLRHKSEDVPVTVLGVGSNLLVRDGGIEGVVIRLGKGFTEIEKHGNT